EALLRLGAAAGRLEQEHGTDAVAELRAAVEAALGTLGAAATAGGEGAECLEELAPQLLDAAWDVVLQCLELQERSGIAAVGMAEAIREALIALAELLLPGCDSPARDGALAPILEDVARKLDALLVELFVGLCRMRDTIACVRSGRGSACMQAVADEMAKHYRAVDSVALWMVVLFARIVGLGNLDGRMLWEWATYDASSALALTKGILSVSVVPDAQLSSEDTFLPSDLSSIQDTMFRALFQLSMPDVAFLSLARWADDPDHDRTIAEQNCALAVHRACLATAMVECDMVSVVIAALWRRPLGAASFLAALLRQPAGETVLDRAAAGALEQSRVFGERLLESSGELWAGLEAACLTCAEASAGAFVEDCAALAYAAPPAAEVCGGMVQAFLGAASEAYPRSLAAVVAFAANSALAPGDGPAADALAAALGAGPLQAEVAGCLGAWRGPLRAEGLAPWGLALGGERPADAAEGTPAASAAAAAPSLLAEAAGVQSLRDLLGGVPPELACALDGKLLMDPVRSPYGHVFERLVLERALTEGGGACPVTGRPLQLSQCQRAPELRLRAVQWIRASRARSG
ncbi:unnamed protein product, partial [Prorocentrum cordatum]